jgi:hypothetical protein
MCFSFSPFFFFSPCHRSYSEHFLFFTCFSVSCHIPRQTGFVSHFLGFFHFSHHIIVSTVNIFYPDFLCFSSYFRSYSVHFSFSTFFSFFSISAPTVCVSHFQPFSVSLPYYRSYSVHLSFSTFFSILAIFRVLQCEFLIFHVFSFLLP